MTMMRRDAVSFLPSFLYSPCDALTSGRRRTAGKAATGWARARTTPPVLMSNYSSNVLPSELTMLQISALWVFTYRNRHWLRGARAWNLVLGTSRPEAEDCGDNSERTFAVTLLQECAAKSVSSKFGGCRYIVVVAADGFTSQVHE